MKRNLVQKLATATPKAGVLQWLACTLFYAAIILLNDHFSLLEAFSLNPRQEAALRLLGAYGYILLTFYQFQKTRRPGVRRAKTRPPHAYPAAPVAPRDAPVTARTKRRVTGNIKSAAKRGASKNTGGKT